MFIETSAKAGYNVKQVRRYSIIYTTIVTLRLGGGGLCIVVSYSVAISTIII